ncbi:MAG: hypothetical protein AAFN78_14105, partial [Pseudomonadota bacterium]
VEGRLVAALDFFHQLLVLPLLTHWGRPFKPVANPFATFIDLCPKGKFAHCTDKISRRPTTARRQILARINIRLH